MFGGAVPLLLAAAAVLPACSSLDHVECMQAAEDKTFGLKNKNKSAKVQK